MKTINRALASLLAAVMLACMLPTAAFAGQTEGTPDEVIYNLLDMPVTVGADPARIESEDELYFLFEEDGSFDIWLEDNAFFPYEVQFTYGGETWSEWFMTPDDTVEVGGHTLTGTSNVTDPEALIQLGARIGEDYIPVYPETKKFTTEPQMSTFSLLPLNTRHLGQLDLRGYFPEELKKITLEQVLGDAYIEAEGKAVLWTKFNYYDENGDPVNSGEFTLLADGTLDLTTGNDLWWYSDHFNLELIVGTMDQLDLDNLRYSMYVYTENPLRADEIWGKACSADGERKPIAVHDVFLTRFSSDDDEFQGYYFAVDPDAWTWGEDIYVSMGFPSLLNSGTDVLVYKGGFTSAEEMQAAGITDADRIDNKLIDTVPAEDGGLLLTKAEYQNWETPQMYTFVFMRNGEVVQYMPMALKVFEDEVSVNVYALTVDDPDSGRVWVDNGWNYDWADDNTEEVTIEVDSEYAKPNDQLHLSFEAYYGPAEERDDETNGIEFVKKAVVGSYKTAAAIPAGAKDIKEQLFSDAYKDGGGYTADYSKGVTFTIVDFRDEIHIIKVTTVAYISEVTADVDKMLDIGLYGLASETDDSGWFFGDLGYTEMTKESDSYYNNGYRTVFVYDAYSTDEFYNIRPDAEYFPIIYYADESELYLGHSGSAGEKFVGGQTKITVGDGEPLTLSNVWSGNVKNYWVTYLTQQKGPKLFVNATNDKSRYVNVAEEGESEDLIPQREVFFTEGANYHDVFFANVGDEDIAGLYAKLENAQNVAMDEYWDIGETTSLAGFRSADYEEMFNMGKIRLVPAKDENGNELSGEISGTLVIGYTGDGTNGEEVRINLTGMSGAGKITTDTLVDATQHVPYEAFIQTNSMSSKNATFSITSGKLPNGLTLEKNGEITGVPSQAGEFTFTVKAVFNNDNSKSDTKEFTLTVLEDTPENIEAVNKGPNGYEIEEHLGTEVTGEDGEVSYELNMKEVADEDLVFVSEGEFDEFVDVYLDGRKLVRDEEYIVEEGSTKITIRAQTFKSAGNGQHVIAAEFRSGETLKKTAQSVTVSGVKTASLGGGSVSTVKQYKITVEPNANGTITCTRTSAREKEVVVVTVQPAAGYIVKSVSAGSGVNVSADSGNKYRITMPASDVTISAVFEAELPFGDVAAEGAFYEAVKFVYDNGIMVGTGENNFAPDANLSRAMVVQVLYNYEKQPEVVAGTDFTDVTEGQWYTSAVRWATEKGVVAGYGDGTFGTNDDVTIEQVAVILWNYAGQPMAEGETVPTESSQWAVNALDWCAKQWILEGIDATDTTVAATRAQTAQILMNFLSKLAQQQF